MAADSSSRLGHIDNLRAVAALLVMWTHLAESFAQRARPDDAVTGFVHWLPPLLNFGHGGVVIFFCISGFVIYGSLARRRENAGRRFALSRFFRLYPAYWVSMLLGLIVLWWVPGTPTPWVFLVANVGMVSGLFNEPRVLGLYWTLETELIFYAFCWALYRSGQMQRAWTLPLLIGVLLALWSRTMPWWLTHTRAHGWEPPSVWFTMPRHLALMFWGALCREAYEQTAGFRDGVRRNGRFWLAVLAGLALERYCALDTWHYFLRGGHDRVTGLHVAPPGSIAYLYALPLFCVWLAVPRLNWRPLRWLGEVSYSLYLFHPVVSGVLGMLTSREPWTGLPLAAYVLLGAAGTVAVSVLTYRAVERPAIRLGAWLVEGRAARIDTPWKMVAP